MGAPSVEVPEEFKKGPVGVGLADEILKAKEEARKRLGVASKSKSKGKGKDSKGKTKEIKSSGKRRSVLTFSILLS